MNKKVTIPVWTLTLFAVLFLFSLLGCYRAVQSQQRTAAKYSLLLKKAFPRPIQKEGMTNGVDHRIVIKR